MESCSLPVSVTSMTMTSFAAWRNGKASWTARRASRVSFHAITTRFAASDWISWRDGQHRPSSSQHQRAGICRTVRIVRFSIAANDHEISSARLTRNEFRRKIQ